MKISFWLIATVALALCPTTSASQQLVERLDHFYIDTSTSQRLYDFLNVELGLPVVWPYSDYGSFASGGLSAGNIVIETLQFEDSDEVARVSGIAYLPIGDAEATASLLDELSIERSQRNPFTVPSEDGQVTLWENITISHLSSENLHVFFCDYKDRQGVSGGQQAASDELRASSGGPLGIVGVSELVLGTTEFNQTIQELQNIGLKHNKNHSFTLPGGVAVRVVESKVDGGLGFSFVVKSLEEAKGWLKENGYLGETESGQPTIKTDLLGDVEIMLVEGQSLDE